MDSCTTGECWVEVHHAGVEAITSVCSDIAVSIQLEFVLVPIAESGYVIV